MRKKKKEAPNYLKDFLEELSKINIKDMDIPEFYIPNWPKETFVNVPLERRECLVLEITDKTGLCKYVERKTKRKSYFNIDNNGSIKFAFYKWKSDWGEYHYDEYSSKSDDKLNRICTLSLFIQFKKELFSQIIQVLEEDVKTHNKIIEETKKAFEPFIPYVMADKLNK